MASSSTQAGWCSTATSRTIRGTATASGWEVRAEFTCIARIEASSESSLTTPDPVRAGAFTLVAFVSELKTVGRQCWRDANRDLGGSAGGRGGGRSLRPADEHVP